MNSFTNNAAAGGGGRRILHQPFFPVESSPAPSQTPAVSSPPKEPSSGDQSPFFPTFPSSPPPPPPSASALATFPANISSLPIPHSSPSPHSPVSPALVAVTVGLSVFAVAVAVFSIFLYFRGRRHRRSSEEEDENKHRAASRSDIATPPPPPPPHPPIPPRLQRNSANNSSEFLYLGTMVNSRAVNAGAAGRKVAFDPRKTDSPDLQPLPPLARPNLTRNADESYAAVQEEEDESFYSPRGSASGRESSLGAGSDSRRAFAAAQNLARIEADSSPECSSSGTGSPARSASLSISPPVSGSTRSSKAKSSPTPSTQLPPSPQLPPMMFSHSHSPPQPPEAYSSPSPDRDSEVKTKEEEEAEESPLLSNTSSSSERSSPVESPCLSPLWSVAGKSSPSPPPAVDWSMFDGNRLSPISDRSTPSTKSSSIKLPRFLGGGGGSKKASPESTKMSNSPASSPESSVTASPISSVSQSSSSKISYSPRRNAISHPSSPSQVADSPPWPQSTPAPPNLAGRRMQSTPASPCFSSKGSQPSSPEVHQLNNITAPPPGPPPPPPPPPPPAMPPPPPPPPAMPPPPIRRSESPISPLPVSKLSTLRVEPENSVKAFGGELNSSNDEAVDANESTPKPKLKPLHWDKVRASSDREMVWDQLRCSSFKLNEEMIETLFVVKNPNSKPKETTAKLVEPSPRQDNINRVLDSKKAQNIAISLRALNVTVEEVCEALLEGNPETLGTELLESLLKMAPTKEEEWKLREYNDDSPCKLGHAEKFLKTLICIPFAFKRIESMLYVANFESEVEYLKKSFETLENACEELRSSRMFLKLLEAVLKTGNRMNVGTNRGDAHAFKLDTLLKLVDVKGTDGKTTLLHFVVQEMIRTEGARLCNVDQAASKAPTANDDARCRKLGLQVVSSLSSELANVKKAAAMDSDSLTVEVAKLSMGLTRIAEVVSSNEKMGSQESSRKFSESMNKFIRTAEEDIIRVQAQESVALSLVKEITEYFHGDSAKEEAHPFRIFMVVRDFLTVLDRVCKEVGTINDRTVVTSGHRFPVPVNPMLPVPVNPTAPQAQGLTELFHQYRRHSSSSDGESS